MAVGLKTPSELLPVSGVALSACAAGIYKDIRPDVALIALADNSSCSVVLTRNRFCAAPVQLAREHLQKQPPRYCFINAGNANAGTGNKGYMDVKKICMHLAKTVKCPPEAILPFSTGVIGEYLPVDKICAVIPDLNAGLDENGWDKCAKAIMTTDTVPKGVSKRIIVNEVPITITGIAKGSGMICPDMATMLAYIATDAAITHEILDILLQQAMAQSFNRICVDGDTSTNDACVLVATGKARMDRIANTGSREYEILSDAICAVCMELAQAIVRDGEGATKFITVRVEQGGSVDECLCVGYAVATSPLVKTALFASDPNWGRILAAVGRSGIDDLDVGRVNIYFNELCIVKQGQRADDYTEAAGQVELSGQDILLRICLGRGKSTETIWTCDLSHDYVTINAEYRT